jgi:pimeloyl-ACP methyl ester carboxylesterase
MATDTREHYLTGGLPCLTVGSGPPVLVIPGLTPENKIPEGMERRLSLPLSRALGPDFCVYWANRRPGLEPGTTIADIASDYATAIEADLGGRADVVGISTGGPIAIQLAIDRPDLVRRLVLVSTGYRLSPVGKRAQRLLMKHVREGNARRGWASLGEAMSSSPVMEKLTAVFMWAAGSLMTPDDPRDMLITLEAEDRFDAGTEMARIAAPTLMINGGKDRFYDVEPIDDDSWIPNVRMVTYVNKGHMGANNEDALQEISRFLQSPERP